LYFQGNKIIKISAALLLTCLPNLAWANGVLEVGTAYYANDNLYDADNVTLDARLRYEHHWQLAQNSSLLVKPRLAFDKGNLFNEPATLHEKNRSRSKFALEELVFTQYINNLELSIGKQVFSWGLADMYNPSDHLNAVDTLDPLDNRKLGQWSASLLYLGTSSNISLIVIPRRSPSRLPQQDNRWFRSTEAIQLAAAAQLGFTPEINLTKQIDHHSASIGAQLVSAAWLPGWDLELSYLHSQDAVGVYLPELNNTVLDLVRVFADFDEASLGLSTAVGEYTFHGITSYRNTTDNAQDDDYLTLLVGARRTFYAPEMLQDVEEITLAVEYVKEKISHVRDPSSAYVSSGFGRTLTNSLLLNLELKFSEDTLLTFGLVQNFDQQNSYVSMEFSHQVVDDFEIKLGLDILNGPAESLFGQWTNNDRLFLNTRYHF
jgi:hypothetical protein